MTLCRDPAVLFLDSVSLRISRYRRRALMLACSGTPASPRHICGGDAMTTFTLTTLQNLFNGGSGTDVFQGPGGGADTLRGFAGNDFFNTQIGQSGLIDGGLGFDTLFLLGSTN